MFWGISYIHRGMIISCIIAVSWPIAYIRSMIRWETKPKSSLMVFANIDATDLSMSSMVCRSRCMGNYKYFYCRYDGSDYMYFCTLLQTKLSKTEYIWLYMWLLCITCFVILALSTRSYQSTAIINHSRLYSIYTDYYQNMEISSYWNRFDLYCEHFMNLIGYTINS